MEQDLTIINKDKEQQEAEALKATVAQEQEGLSINNKNAVLIKDSLEKLNTIAETIKAALIEGLDYGIIPGVKKPSLFKPGAEKIALMYGLTQQYELLEQVRDRENGIILYRFKAMLFNSQNKQIAEGYGFCTSEEKKYKNQNCFDIENTLMKMAKKRALVDAAISIGVLSQVFTQDVEDMKLTAAGAELGRWEKLGIYTLIYNIFAEFLPNFKSKDDYKTAMKGFIPSLIKNSGVQNLNIMEFTLQNKNDLLNYVNDPKNFENEKARFKEKYKLQ